MHKTGLILGKFMPLHSGHINLIEFGLNNCNKLIVLVCSEENEEIPGTLRFKWLLEYFENRKNIELLHFEYDSSILPNTSVSSVSVSELWSKKLLKILPHIDVIFSSETYGDYLADFMKCTHKAFDINRNKTLISSTMIREKPFKYWSFIPDNVKPYFVFRVCIVGSESTGKSTLTEKLALYFTTNFVPEVARDIVAHTDTVVFEDLNRIAEAHAKKIEIEIKKANKILIIDTDLIITKSYSLFLFGKELTTSDWIEKLNQNNLYLFLETDCPFIQDGTRLDEETRNTLSLHHKQVFKNNGVTLNFISGSWEDRFQKAVKIIEDKIRIIE